MKKLKVAFIILLIILISLISFGGIFVKNTKFVNNIVPQYSFGTDLTGYRLLEINVSDEVNTTIYDKDGNVVDEEGEGTTKKEEPVNPEDTLTLENYKKAKEIISNRLDQMKIKNYSVRLNESNGSMCIQLPEDDQTDNVLSLCAVEGDFTVVDEETNEVLLNKSNIDKAYCGYSSGTSGTTVYLSIQFNKEGTEKLKEISNTYVSSVDDEGNTTTKNVHLNVDDTTLMDTYFSEEISNGMIQLSIGQASTSSETLNTYAQEASRLAVLLNDEQLPLTYSIEQNRYIVSDMQIENLYIPIIVLLAVFAVALVFLIIRYRKNGLLSSISIVGYTALYLLVIRYANVTITLDGIASIAITIALNYMFSMYLLHLLKHEDDKTIQGASISFRKASTKALFVLIPLVVTAVILSFVSWESVYSFGMTMFWGILLGIIYNFIITRTLILSSTKNNLN